MIIIPISEILIVSLIFIVMYIQVVKKDTVKAIWIMTFVILFAIEIIYNNIIKCLAIC